MLKTHHILFFLCWPQGQAAVGRCTLQSCHCSHVLQTVSRFSQWIALYWWGEKKTHKNPRKKIRSSRPHISTSPVQRACTFQSQHFSSLSGLRGWGGGVWNLSSVYKWNQDKAECFLLSSTQWQIQTTRSPSFLLSGPEIGWEQDLKDTTSTFFFITSLHMTVQAKEPTWCKLNLFEEEDCFSWTDLQASEANSTVEIQVFKNPNMPFSSSNALSSNSPPRSRKKTDSSYFSLIFHSSFLSLFAPPPQTNRRNLLPSIPPFCRQWLGNQNLKQLPSPF